MPSPLSFIKLRDAEYVDQFAGSVVPELKDAQKVLNERYDLAEENDSKRAAVAREMMQNVAKKDEVQARLAYEKAMGDIEANKARGDYENMYGKTANSARQFSVNAAKFIKEKQLMDAEWKRVQELKGVSDSQKQEIWDNITALNNKPLTFNPEDNVVEGEHFKSVNIADDVDKAKLLAGYGSLMKADVDAGKSDKYGYFTPDGKRVTSSDPNAILFKVSNGKRVERVTETDLDQMGRDILKADPKVRDEADRYLRQKTGLKFKEIDENPNLTVSEKQIAKDNLVNSVQKDMEENQYKPAIEAIKNIFGYHNIAKENKIDFDALGLFDLKSKAAREQVVRDFSSETSPSTPTVNPYAPKVSTIDPKNPPTNLVTIGNSPIGSKEELANVLMTKGVEIKRPMTESQALELADRALNFSLHNQDEFNSTTNKLKLYGVNVRKYSEQEIEKIKTNEANEMMASNLNFNLPQGLVDNANMNPVMTLNGMSAKQVQDLYKKVIPAMGKISLSGHIASPDMNKNMSDVLYSQADQSKFEFHDGDKVVEFNGLNEVRDYMVEKGYKTNAEMKDSDFQLVNRRTLSTNGEHGDFQVKIKGDKKDLSLYTRGGDGLTRYTAAVNEVAKNSFLQGKDTYTPDSPGQIDMGGIPTEYFTKTVPNKHFDNKKDQIPFITVVYSRPLGENSSFVARPLMNYKEYPSSKAGSFLNLAENIVFQKLSNTPFAGTKGLTEKEAKNTLGLENTNLGTETETGLEE